jgi:hypothetical protein
VAKTEAPEAARRHLARLATVLERRGWRVRLTATADEPLLTVNDPDRPG